MTRRVFAAIVAIAALLATPVLPGTGTTVLAEACNGTNNLAYTDHFPSFVADGGRMTWRARNLFANDWLPGGFAAQVLWVGTNDVHSAPSFTWVEVGLTHGWQGQNLYTGYSAHGINGSYDEFKMGLAGLTIGSQWRFTVEQSGANSYTAKIYNFAGTTWSKLYNGHTLGTVSISGGLESFCGNQNNRIDRTNVTNVFLRRDSDGAYIGSTNGAFGTVGAVNDPDGGIAWCNQPWAFRYWMNSQIATNIC